MTIAACIIASLFLWADGASEVDKTVGFLSFALAIILTPFAIIEVAEAVTDYFDKSEW